MHTSTATPDPARFSNAKVQMLANFSRFKTSALSGIDPAAFQKHIDCEIGCEDPAIENFAADEIPRQRDLSVKFHWGHNHDFGNFTLKGRMAERHVDVMARFMALFPVSPSDFQNTNVLDVGCWTGGTTLLLSTLSQKVHALEEVRKYADMAQFLAKSFGLQDRVSIEAKSIYECNDPAFYDRFQVVYFPGVIYHLSDPVLALRILFNALKPGGLILVESAGIPGDEPICEFQGTFTYTSGSAEQKNRGGWNWFIPTPVTLDRMLREAGFEEMQCCYATDVKRVYGFARKLRQNPICRAGLSVRSIR
jgi:2-polyprenyl-3-methyl-5-hydroxy-6-metoxy-1,4-benzoquinol methylase